MQFTEQDDFQVILPQVSFGNITVNKPTFESHLMALTVCVWLQRNGSTVEIKYVTKSDGCDEINALGILFNSSITITILGNEW